MCRLIFLSNTPHSSFFFTSSCLFSFCSFCSGYVKRKQKVKVTGFKMGYNVEFYGENGGIISMEEQRTKHMKYQFNEDADDMEETNMVYLINSLLLFSRWGAKKISFRPVWSWLLETERERKQNKTKIKKKGHDVRSWQYSTLATLGLPRSQCISQ